VIDQNILSVGQLHERGFIVIFENNHSVIKDASDKVIFSIKMRSKSFSFNPMKEKLATYQVTIDNTEIWLKRLGHLQRNELVHVLPFEQAILRETKSNKQDGPQKTASLKERKYEQILHRLYRLCWGV